MIAKPDLDDSRLKMIIITERDVLSILSDTYHVRRIANLPNDFKVKAVHYEPHHGGFAVAIWSMTFDIVEPGSQYPVFNAIYRDFKLEAGK